MLVTLAVNGLIFKYLLTTRATWRDVWTGALSSAVAWEIATQLLAFYIGWSSFASAYEAISPLLVAMAWIYFCSQILFMGAVFTRVYSCRYSSRAMVNAAGEPG